MCILDYSLSLVLSLERVATEKPQEEPGDEEVR